MVIEADAIKNRNVMLKHLSSSDFTKNDPTLSSYVHEYSTKAAEAMLVAAGELIVPCHAQSEKYFSHVRHGISGGFVHAYRMLVQVHCPCPA